MSAFTNIATKLKAFEADQDGVMLDLVHKNEYTPIEMNKLQMYSGKRADGTDIEPEYTGFTKRIKLENHQVIDRVTLKDKGDAHDSVEMEYRQSEFELIALDPKIPKLIKKYGKEILGLTDENLQAFTGILKDELIDHIKTNILNA